MKRSILIQAALLATIGVSLSACADEFAAPDEAERAPYGEAGLLNNPSAAEGHPADFEQLEQGLVLGTTGIGWARINAGTRTVLADYEFHLRREAHDTSPSRRTSFSGTTTVA